MTIKHSLQTAFYKAAGTKAAQFAIRNAGSLSGAFFAACDLGLIAKDYVLEGRLPDRYEQMSGGVFLATDGLLALSDRYPSVKKVAGAMFIVGGSLLGYSGLGSEGQNAQLLSTTIIAAQGLALMFENGLQTFAAGMAEHKKGVLKAVFTPLARYPVLTTSAIGLLSMVSLFVAAIQKGDPGLVYVSIMGMLGQTSLMAMDNNIKALAARPEQLPEKSPAPG